MKLTPYQAWVVQEGLLKKAMSIIQTKRTNYAGTSAFGNFDTSEVVGVEPWRGAMVRFLDKFVRVKNMNVKTTVDWEFGILNDSADAINYISIILGTIMDAMPDDKAQAMYALLEAEAKKPWPYNYADPQFDDGRP